MANCCGLLLLSRLVADHSDASAGMRFTPITKVVKECRSQRGVLAQWRPLSGAILYPQVFSRDGGARN